MKLYQDCLGYADILSCARLIDSGMPDELEDAILTGTDGGICSNGIQKPLFGILRSCRGLGNRIIFSEPGCIISKVGEQRYRGFIYNYRHLNFLFYSDDRCDLSPKDVEMYLEEAANKTFHICIRGVENAVYHIVRYIFTKEHGSVFDAWVKRNCQLGARQYDWLKVFSTPDIMIETVNVENEKLELEYVLKPMELMSMEITFE